MAITLGARMGRMGSWLSFPLCGEPETHVPAPMNGLVATVLLQLPFIKHVYERPVPPESCSVLQQSKVCAMMQVACEATA